MASQNVMTRWWHRIREVLVRVNRFDQFVTEIEGLDIDSSTDGPGTGTLPAADHRRRSVCPTDKSSPTRALEMARHESRGLTGHPGLLIG